MKKHGYIIGLIAAILCFGCSRTTLQRDKTRVSIKSDSAQSNQLKSSKDTDQEEVVTVNADSSSFAAIYTFDTDKPVDPKTGLSPLKSLQITGTYKKEEKSAAKTVRQKEKIDKKEETKAATDTNTKSDTTIKTESGKDYIPIIMLLLFLTGMCVVFWDQIKAKIKKWKG